MTTERSNTSDRWQQLRVRQRRAIAEGVISATADPARDPLSVAAVAQAAGMSRKTFYKYFESLDAALAYTAELVWREMMGLDHPPADPTANGRERFMALHEHMIETGLRRPELARFQAYFDHAYRGPALPLEAERDYAAVNRRMWLDLERVFREGQADGSIRVDLDPRLTITAVGSGSAGLVLRLLALHWDDDIDDAAVFRVAMDAWRAYLAPRQPSCP